MRGRYASYWNAFLLQNNFSVKITKTDFILNLVNILCHANVDCIGHKDCERTFQHTLAHIYINVVLT